MMVFWDVTLCRRKQLALLQHWHQSTNAYGAIYRTTVVLYRIIIYPFLTAIELTPGGSSTVHIHIKNSAQNTETGSRITIKKSFGSAGRAPSLRVIP
jgi:hypothetical protein